MITVSAVLPLTVVYAITSFFRPGTVPYIIQILSGVSVIFFQTMDAVDGKQARKLGTSSSLGDFLDHVIDSFCIMIIVADILSTCPLGNFPLEIACLAATTLDFFVIHWESAKIYVMTLDDGTSITEAQIIFALVFLGEPFFGHHFWDTKLFGVLPTFSQLMFTSMIILICAIQTYKSVSRVLTTPYKSENNVAFKHPPAVLIELIAPVTMLVVLGFVWAFTLGEECRTCVQLIFIAITVMVSVCITLDRIAHEPIRVWLPLPLVAPGIVLPFVAKSLVPYYTAAVVAVVFLFICQVVNDIAKKLGLPVFANYDPATIKKEN